MTPDALAADNGILTIDQAVEAISAPPEPEKKPKVEPAAQAEAPETETEADPAALDTSEPETATDGEDAEPAEEAEGEQPELPPIAPPQFWDAKSKERFGELPRDLQELVLAKESERDRATSTAMQKAAETRKAAEAEGARIAQINGAMDRLLPQAIETFKGRWEGVDWNAVVDQYGAEQALKLRNDFERERGMVQQLSAAKAQAEEVQFNKFVEAETAKLPELAPELADPKAGMQRRKELGSFLLSTGVPELAIRHMTANETALAYDAMRWRQANASAKAKAASPATPNKSAAPAKPNIRPTAATGTSNPQSARLRVLTQKRSLTIDEAVELANMKDASR